MPNYDFKKNLNIEVRIRIAKLAEIFCEFRTSNLAQ